MGRIRCDLEAVLDRIGGDRDLLAQLASVVLEDLTAMLDAVDQAIRVRDAVETRRTAHRLKGAVGNFEVQPLFDLALSIERAGAEERLDDAVRDWATLNSYINEFRTFLMGMIEQQP